MFETSFRVGGVLNDASSPLSLSPIDWVDAVFWLVAMISRSNIEQCIEVNLDI